MANMDEEAQKAFKETKRELDQFVDGLIETLNSEFGEKSVTPYSSRFEKVMLLKKL
jgi:DNA anti-recombination protein RmuC